MKSWHFFARQFHQSTKCLNYNSLLNTLPSSVRNIGIISHIDAGKTTTTERMIFYSGLTNRIGNVDEGDTVTDYLTQEKDRGITIQSAAVTIPWNNYKINVIDTPGHADFTFEVIRSLKVLDGAITILDSVAGVEAQTEKVWRQAKERGIPIIAFVNKMDRDGSGFGRTVKEIVGKLGTRALLVNIPYFEIAKDGGKIFKGVADILTKKLLIWEDVDGKDVKVIDLDPHDQNIIDEKYFKIANELANCREAVVEQLGELDEHVIDCFLETENYMKVPTKILKDSLRKLTIAGKVTPILCGASFKNIGVQPLLDAVIDFLPSPLEILPPQVSSSTIKKFKKENKKLLTSSIESTIDAKFGCIINNNKNLTTALAFKVIHHPNRGLMVFVRIYSGKLESGSQIINSRTGEKIKINKLLIMNGEDPLEVKFLSAGDIGVITGSNEIFTGDTLITNAKNKSTNGITSKEENIQLLPIPIPPPVFSVSIEPDTIGAKRKLDESLSLLLKEDPSLKLDFDEETDQTILSGMGELHLEIIKDRLVSDMKVPAEIGQVRVSFKESILKSSNSIFKSNESTSDDNLFSVSLSLHPFENDLNEALEFIDHDSNHLYLLDENNALIFAPNSMPEIIQKAFSANKWPMFLTFEKIIKSLLSGATGALHIGGPLHLPLHSIIVKIESWSIPSRFDLDSVTPMIQLTREAIRNSLDELSNNNKTVLEPVMLIKIQVPESDVGIVSQDLMSARNAKIMYVEEEGHDGEIWAREQMERTYTPKDETLKGVDVKGRVKIVAEAPLRDMIGYLGKLRGLTGGRGSLDMELSGMARVGYDRIGEILN